MARCLTQNKHLSGGVIFVVLDVVDFLVKKQQASQQTSRLLMTRDLVDYVRRGAGGRISSLGVRLTFCF